MVSPALVAQSVSYSFEEARDLMLQHSAALKVANAEVQMVSKERQRVNALW